MNRPSRVVDLPSKGRLFAATDLQGNLQDFSRIVQRFEEHQAAHGDAFLVLTGDLIHGPELATNRWPEHLGTYYRDESVALLDAAMALQRRYPERITYLLGNHEHAHIGGPVVGKFFPDEAARLEHLLGGKRAQHVRAWFSAWPLVAVAPQARLCLVHAAPRAPLRSREEINALRTDLAEDPTFDDSSSPAGLLGSLLWARTTSLERAHAFLRALGSNLTTAVFGHDVAREGFAVDHSPCLCLSSSFGCYNGDKLILVWDLAEPATSAHDLVRHGLQRLWPEEPPILLDVDFLQRKSAPCPNPT